MYRQPKKKNVKQQYLPHMSSQYGELLPTNGWDFNGCPHQSSQYCIKTTKHSFRELIYRRFWLGWP